MIVILSDHWLSVLHSETRERGAKLLVLMRGLPGSGKSTLAHCVKAACSDPESTVPEFNASVPPPGFDNGDGWAMQKKKEPKPKQDPPNGPLVVSADDFFIDRSGHYVFLPNLLPKAHEWCQSSARKAMRAGRSPVVVDNTNLQAWEMQPYLRMARENGFKVLIFFVREASSLHCNLRNSSR